MDRIVRQITGQLTDLLPDDGQYYRLDELRSLGFPGFIVHRIQVELERNLGDSMILPQTDWANMESPAIQAVWEQFIEAIRQEARLPASYSQTVIETAVADILDMLVQPRKNIPEVIFGAEEELTRDQVVERMDSIVVYRHFASLIPRYMQKKELQTLSRERCSQIITNADKRLTSRYSPLNWAQMLNPLFSLLNQRIDTNLLRLFFEDKNMPRLARQFDKLNSSVDRAQLIEVLSSPESLNLEGYEDDQSELFEEKETLESADQPEKSVEPQSPSKKESKRNGAESSSKSGKSSPKPASPHEDPIVGAFHEFRKGLKGGNQEELEEEEYNINSAFSEREEEEEIIDPMKGSSLNDIFLEDDEDEDTKLNVSEENGIRDTGKEKTENKFQEPDNDIVFSEPERKESAGDQGIEKDDEFKGKKESDEETPMWKRFLSPEELARLDEEEEKKPDEEGFLDEPVTDLTEDPERDNTGKNMLKELLRDDRSFFVEEIFGGSDMAYDETLDEIALKEDWRSASKYIEKEVFQRNLVNMYSEAAVDFTDRLHTYFLKKSKS